MIDFAIGAAFAFLSFASAPFAFRASAAAASSSPPSAKGSKSSSLAFWAAWTGAGVDAGFGASTTAESLVGSTGLTYFSHIFTLPTTDFTALSLDTL